ncbi:MAG TPA: LCP family protein [Bacillota bacterium]|nr:LCP family protein [Bacillota bacterium]
MSRGFKTFFITFLVGLLVFGLAASYILNNYVDDFIDQMFGLGETSKTESTASEDDTSSDASLTDVSSDASRDDVSYSDDFAGESMGTLMIFENAAGEADTIILVRRSKENTRAFATVIPADTRMYIDGKNTELRDLLKTRDAAFFAAKTEAITGVAINYYMIVPFENVNAFAQSLFAKFTNLTYTAPYAMVEIKEPEEDESTDEGSGESVAEGESAAPEYIVNITAGKHTLDADMFVGVLYFYLDGSAEKHNALVEGLASTLFTQMYTSSNKSAITDVAEALLSLANTNMTKENVQDNIDIITSYTSFSTTFIKYPGTYRELAGKNIYFNPDIDSAISAFKAYR